MWQGMALVGCILLFFVACYATKMLSKYNILIEREILDDMSYNIMQTGRWCLYAEKGIIGISC